jgi:hypothetical protein
MESRLGGAHDQLLPASQGPAFCLRVVRLTGHQFTEVFANNQQPRWSRRKLVARDLQLYPSIHLIHLLERQPAAVD